MKLTNEHYTRYQYENAPLKEVIFEAKFFDESYDLTLPGSFFQKVSAQFPNKKIIQHHTFILSNQPSPQEKPPPFQAPEIQAWNEQKNKCLQVGPGIIAANDKAYRNWENFSKNIKFLLDSYLECGSPTFLQRIGYRCINRILIPDSNVSVSDYFKLSFGLPNELLSPTELCFSFSKEFTYKEVNIGIIIRFATDPLVDNESGVAFILDIDSFITEDIDIKRDKILLATSICHDVEKIVFESLLKDKLRKLLGGRLI